MDRNGGCEVRLLVTIDFQMPPIWYELDPWLDEEIEWFVCYNQISF